MSISSFCGPKSAHHLLEFACGEKVSDVTLILSVIGFPTVLGGMESHHQILNSVFLFTYGGNVTDVTLISNVIGFSFIAFLHDKLLPFSILQEVQYGT